MRWTRWGLAAVLWLGACGDDPAPASPDADAGADTGDEDTGSDAGDEVSADVGGDEGGHDVAPDVPDEDTDTCQHACLDEFGKNKKSLCPQPIADWNCVQGCCVAVFKCQTDGDCRAQGFAEGHCTDERFDCRCETSTGVCGVWYCAADGDCGAGEACVAGACQAATAVDGLALRVVSAPTVLVPGATTALLVEAYDPTNPDVVTAAEVTWASSDDAVIAVADGVATGGAAAGEVTLTASMVGAPSQQATVTLTNVVPAAGETVTVIARVEGTLAPVAGHYALVDAGTGEVVDKGAIADDGVIRFGGSVPAEGLDVHVFGDATDWVSWLRFQGGALLLPIPAWSWGEVELTAEEEIVPEGTQLIGASLVHGVPDMSLYPLPGEFELSLNAFALSSALFDFSLPSLLGGDVKRYLEEDSGLPIETADQAEIPGGITFGFAGNPVVGDFWLTAGPAQRRLWTLGGRIELTAVAEFADDIFDAVGGGSVDFNVLVSALFPLFRNFWSGYHPDLDVATGDALDVTDVDPLLRIPLGLKTHVLVPDLPPMATAGYADSVFILGGALTADGLFVPLGLNGGSDSSDPAADPLDGKADADPLTPAKDPYLLPVAPLHSGLGGPHTAYAFAVVAASLRASSGDPRPEGGSAILKRMAPGEAPAAAPDMGEFLGFPMGSAWDPDTREIAALPLEGADTQRVLFKGKQGANWTVWLSGVETYTVPDPNALLELGLELGDRTTNVSLVLVNSFDLADGVDLDDLGTPGGWTLGHLLHVVDRVSFVDVRP